MVPSEKELLVDGRKVVGSAQKRGRRAFLQHGSVPLTIDYQALARATADAGADLAGYRRAFAGLADLRPGLGAEEVRRHLALGFAQQFPGPWEDRPLSAEERARAVELARERYSTEAWTRRC
jgi:lipoate-protein ligase A